MDLYFIRHAEPDYEHDTITENGHVQAEKLADYYEDLKIDQLYHSSMGRAAITTGYLARKWKLEPVSIDWARELKWGKATGDVKDNRSPWTLKDQIIKKEKSYTMDNQWKNLPEFIDDDIVQDYDFHCQALDEFLSKNGYFREGLLYRAVKPNNKAVVIVCHGGAISTFVSHLLNIPFLQFITHFGVGLTSVTKIHLSGEEGDILPAEVNYLNQQVHLGVK